MLRLMRGFIVLLCCLIIVIPSALAQLETPSQTIKGDTYVIKDISGRLVYLQVDKNTKRERVLVPGERIEADVITGERVVAVRPAK